MLRVTTIPRLVVAIAVVVGCAGPDRSVTSDDHAVYAAVIDSLFGPRTWKGVTRVVVGDSTDRYLRAELVPGVLESFLRLPGVDSAMIRSFEVRNRVARPLEGLPAESGIEVTLARAAELDSLPRTDVEAYWAAVRALYPGSQGLVSVSSVGYNTERTLAIVKVRHGCGGLCGSGHDVLLRRAESGWRISAAAMTFVM